MTGAIAEIVVTDGLDSLRTVLDEHKGTEIELRTCAAARATVTPLVWVHGSERAIDAVTSAFEAEPTVASYQRLNEERGQHLYRIEWTDRPSVLERLVEQDGTVLSAGLGAGGWRVRILFPTRESLSAAYDTWDAQRWDLRIARITACDGMPVEVHGLTDGQYEALERAVEMGYYEIPRQTTLEELADDLGISHQALSERLRRANRTLITNLVGESGTSENGSKQAADSVRIVS